MSSFVVVVTGIGGDEKFLAHSGETEAAAKAQRFRSPHTATGAAQAHIGAWPGHIQRKMAFRVEAAR